MGNTVDSERLYSVFCRCATVIRYAYPQDIPVPPGQLRLLAYLEEQGQVTQKSLQEHLQVKGSSISSMLTKLEKNGYLCRLRDERDKRSVLVEILPTGSEIVRAKHGQQLENAKEIFSCLTEEEQGELLDSLYKLIMHMEQK